MDKTQLTEQACNKVRDEIKLLGERYCKGLITFSECIAMQADLMDALGSELLAINFTV